MKRWLFLHIWCRHLYRPTMRLMHRFNLHYAPPSPMPPENGRRLHWCQWCGLRDMVYHYDPNAPLHPLTGPDITFKEMIAATDNIGKMLESKKPSKTEYINPINPYSGEVSILAILKNEMNGYPNTFPKE